MNIKSKIAGSALLILAVALVFSSCQKMERPPLGDYPKDANPPGGPLKFFAAYDGGNVDSIRANFGVDNNVTFVDGISGKAMSAGADGYVSYSTANDFKKSSSFTIAFWMNKQGPNVAGAGAAFAFGLGSTSGIWTQQEIFLLIEDAGQSTADSAAAKFYLNDQWFEFVGIKRLPKLLDGQWHHLAFSFDQTNSTLTTHLDGAPYTNLPANFGKFNNNNGQVNFAPLSGLVVGGPGHYAIGKTPDSWMANFNGQIDQFRLYSTALSAAEINELFTTKK